MFLSIMFVFIVFILFKIILSISIISLIVSLCLFFIGEFSYTSFYKTKFYTKLYIDQNLLYSPLIIFIYGILANSLLFFMDFKNGNVYLFSFIIIFICIVPLVSFIHYKKLLNLIKTITIIEFVLEAVFIGLYIYVIIYMGKPLIPTVASFILVLLPIVASYLEIVVGRIKYAKANNE